MRLLGSIVLVGLVGFGPVACSENTSSTTLPSESVCAHDPRVEAYATDLSAHSKDGTVTIRFLDAEPSPPTVGEDTWTIAVDDASGRPIEGATITTVPFMPDHGHGASIIPTTTPAGAPGQYTIGLLELFMPGVWQITFTVTPPHGTPETVLFTFCIDG